MVSCENVRSTITSTQRSRLCAISLKLSRASNRLFDWSTNIVVPPSPAMPASNVSRVLSDGFSKNMTICLPASDRENTEGRDFISSARCSTASTPCGPRSRVETKSGHQKIPGNVSGTIDVFCNCVFNLGSNFPYSFQCLLSDLGEHFFAPFALKILTRSASRKSHRLTKQSTSRARHFRSAIQLHQIKLR